MNRQKMYDTVKAHLLKQGAKAMGIHNGVKTCMYRAPGGKMCAAGCLIPDKLYSSTFEGEAICTVFEQCPELKKHLKIKLYDDVRFLTDLQCVHDGYYVTDWEDALYKFAKTHGVKP